MKLVMACWIIGVMGAVLPIPFNLFVCVFAYLALMVAIGRQFFTKSPRLVIQDLAEESIDRQLSVMYAEGAVGAMALDAYLTQRIVHLQGGRFMGIPLKIFRIWR